MKDIHEQGGSALSSSRGEQDAGEIVDFLQRKGVWKQNYAGQHFWARGYMVSTVGRDEKSIRDYIRNQEAEDKRIDQMQIWN